MNHDDIIRMAQDCLVRSEYTEFGWQECYRYEFEVDELIHFAELVAAAEREACAKVCEDEAWRLKKIAVDTQSSATNTKAIGAFDLATVIRARGQNERANS